MSLCTWSQPSKKLCTVGGGGFKGWFVTERKVKTMKRKVYKIKLILGQKV